MKKIVAEKNEITRQSHLKLKGVKKIPSRQKQGFSDYLFAAGFFNFTIDNSAKADE